MIQDTRSERQKYVDYRISILTDMRLDEPSKAEYERLIDEEHTTLGAVDAYFRDRIINEL